MKIKSLMLITLLVVVSGCATLKPKDYRDQLSQVKTVAVVLFTVPEKISYRKDPREILKKNILTKAMAMAAEGEGQQAATLAHQSFIAEINARKLSFVAMDKSAMLANEQFARLIPDKAKLEIAGVDLKLVSSAMSMFNITAKSHSGAAPEAMHSYGLAAMSKGALTGQATEMEFIQNTIAVLGVDAAIVVADPGMSFYCKTCVRIMGAGASGTGTTGAVFGVALVSKDGTVLLRQKAEFKGTEASAKMVASAVNPLEHDQLYQAHGKKIAAEFAEYFARYMNRGS